MFDNLYQTPWGVSVVLAPPTTWTVVLGVPIEHRSLHGSVEDAFWREHLPISANVSAATAYAILLRVLPGIISKNFEEVSNGLREAYRETKLIEEQIQSNCTKFLLEELRDRYQFAGITSLGPAVYALVESPPTRKELRALEYRHGEFRFITFPMSGFDKEKIE